jgi:hypothetical protein
MIRILGAVAGLLLVFCLVKYPAATGVTARHMLDHLVAATSTAVQSAAKTTR